MVQDKDLNKDISAQKNNEDDWGKPDFTSRSCRDFIEVLASKEPVPGGGGASALVGAIGTALGNMVGSLTVGKKKYADVEEEMIAMKAECDALQDELLSLVQRDAEVFSPLAAAYSMPKSTPEELAEKERVMEIVLKDACDVPMEIMEACAKALELMVEFAHKGSVLAVSDAAAGAVLCKAAMQAASLNVFINTKSMKDRETAARLNEKANGLLDRYTELSDEVFGQVMGRLQG